MTDARATHVTGILLAAGAGTRMGMSKALVRWNGTHLVEHGVRTLLAGGCESVVTVLGSRAAEVLETVDLGRSTVVVADDWSVGVSASLRAGLLTAASSDADAAVVALVDQPLVGVWAIRRLVTAAGDGATVALATYSGRPGHPVLFHRQHWMSLRGQGPVTSEICTS